MALSTSPNSTSSSDSTSTSCSPFALAASNTFHPANFKHSSIIRWNQHETQIMKDFIQRSDPPLTSSLQTRSVDIDTLVDALGFTRYLREKTANGVLYGRILEPKVRCKLKGLVRPRDRSVDTASSLPTRKRCAKAKDGNDCDDKEDIQPSERERKRNKIHLRRVTTPSPNILQTNGDHNDSPDQFQIDDVLFPLDGFDPSFSPLPPYDTPFASTPDFLNPSFNSDLFHMPLPPYDPNFAFPIDSTISFPFFDSNTSGFFPFDDPTSTYLSISTYSPSFPTFPTQASRVPSIPKHSSQHKHLLSIPHPSLLLPLKSQTSIIADKPPPPLFFR